MLSLGMTGIQDFSINICNNSGTCQHKQALHFRGSPDTFPQLASPGRFSGNHGPLKKRADTEIWRLDREGQRDPNVIGVNHPVG